MNLSLVDHYVKMELTNHADQDYYIPHLTSFFSIYDANGIDVTNGYGHPMLLGSGPDFDILENWGSPHDDFVDYDYYSQKEIYFNEALKINKEIFLKLNPSITEETIREEYGSDFDGFLEILCMISKCDGVAIKAGQTLNVYQDICGLLKNISNNPNEKFSIHFSRHNDWNYSAYETVSADGYNIYTSLPNLCAGYKLYEGSIDCADVVYLDKEDKLLRYIVRIK